MTLLIRAAGIEDSATLATLNQYAQAPHIAARPDVFKPTRQIELEAWYRTRLGAATTRAWIAEIDGQPVGYVRSVRREAEETPFSVARRWLELEEIAVAATQRQQGIARALVEQVLAHARAERLTSVELGSWSFNAEAHAAFEKLGFARRMVRFERRVD